MSRMSQTVSKFESKGRRRWLICNIIVIAVVPLILSIAIKGFAQVIEFRFNPPDGITYVETLKTTKVKDMGSLGKQTDVGENKTRVSIKKTPNGYSVVATPISTTLTRNGEKIESPMTALLQDTVVTYDLDADGKLLAIHGYDTIMKRALETAPPEMAQSLSSIFNEKLLVNKETAHWNSRIGDFIGRKAKVGDAWTSTKESEVPTGGTALSYSATKIVAQVKCGEHDCVQVQFGYTSDANALKNVDKFLTDVFKAAGVGKEMPGISATEIVGGGERLIDPATMLIYSETGTQTLKMQMEVPGQGKLMVTMQEKKEYTFDYPH